VQFLLLQFQRGLGDFCNRGSEPREVADIPRQQDFRASLQGTPRDERIVDSGADNRPGRGGFQGRDIFPFAQRNNRESFRNLPNDAQSFRPRDARSNRQAGESGIDFAEGAKHAEVFFPSGEEHFRARSVLRMVGVENRNQNRTVKKLLQLFPPKMRRALSSRPRRIRSSTTPWGTGFPVR